MANKTPKNSNPVEAEELSADDYAIIAAGLTALGDFFAFLSLVKAREVTKETGVDIETISPLFLNSRRKR